MNSTEFIQVPINTLAETLGVSSSVLTILLFLFAAVALSIAIWQFTGSYLLSLILSSGVFIVGSFMGILPLWVALLVMFIGLSTVIFSRFFNREDTPIGGLSGPIGMSRNSKEIVLRLEKSSEKFSQYINNLDELLGIKTKELTSVPGGLRLDTWGSLWIDTEYDWYISDKYPTETIFKVVGLHRDDSLKNLVYLLGRHPISNSTFLAKVSNIYLEGSIDECLLWASRHNCGFNFLVVNVT